MRKLTFFTLLLSSLSLSLSAQYFSAVYPNAGSGLAGSPTGGGYLLTTTSGILKVGLQGQPAWNRQLTGIFLLDASGLDNGQAALTGFKGDDAYFNTIDTNGILQQSSVYALTNFTGQQDVGQAVRWAGGFYCLAGTFREPGAAGTEAFFMCLNSSHNITMAYKMEGPQSEVFSGLSPVLSGGGFSLLANTDSDGAGGTDVLLLRTANDGSLQGSTLFGGAGEDMGWAVRPLTSGGFAVVGETSSFGNQQQGFLARLDGSGNLQWARGFSNVASLADVAELPDGSLVMIGNRGPSANPEDIVLLKTDASGQLQWARAYGESNTAEQAGGLTALPDGGFLLTGSSGAPSFNNLFVARTDADGRVDNCTGNSLNVTASTISFQTPQPSGQLTYNLATSQVSRSGVVTNFSSPSVTPSLCVTSGVRTVEGIPGTALSIYPNPSPTPPRWAIECEQAMPVEARLTDAFGRILLRKELLLSAGRNEWRPEMGSLPKGVYTASISNGQGVVSKKVVIQ